MKRAVRLFSSLRFKLGALVLLASLSPFVVSGREVVLPDYETKGSVVVDVVEIGDTIAFELEGNGIVSFSLPQPKKDQTVFFVTLRLEANIQATVEESTKVHINGATFGYHEINPNRPVKMAELVLKDYTSNEWVSSGFLLSLQGPRVPSAPVYLRFDSEKGTIDLLGGNTILSANLGIREKGKGSIEVSPGTGGRVRIYSIEVFNHNPLLGGDDSNLNGISDQFEFEKLGRLSIDRTQVLADEGASLLESYINRKEG